MIANMVLGGAMCTYGLWCIYAGDVELGIAYLGICALCVGDANTQEELDYLRNEIKALHEHQHR